MSHPDSLQVDSFVQDAMSQGAKVVKGGKRNPLGDTFYEPTLLTDVNTNMLCVKEEIFGPVVGIMK